MMTPLSRISRFAQNGRKLGGAPSSAASAKDHLEFLQVYERQIRHQQEGAEENDEVRRCVGGWPVGGKL